MNRVVYFLVPAGAVVGVAGCQLIMGYEDTEVFSPEPANVGGSGGKQTDGGGGGGGSSGEGGAAGVAAAAGASGDAGGVAGSAGVSGSGGIAGSAGASGSGGASGQAGSSGAGGTGGTVCGSPSGGLTMVKVPEGFCIDSTEVTRGQYQAWLDTQPSIALQPSECTWNGDFEPTCAWPPEAGELKLPVVCVDWCDAYAFCAGVGKRLCGRIGNGGANDYNAYNNYLTSEWFAVCSASDNLNDYPYGSAYGETTCNGADTGNGQAVAVATMGDCHASISGYEEIYDLSGNVSEWVNACNGMTGSSDTCRIRGG